MSDPETAGRYESVTEFRLGTGSALDAPTVGCFGTAARDGEPPLLTRLPCPASDGWQQTVGVIPIEALGYGSCSTEPRYGVVGSPGFDLKVGVRPIFASLRGTQTVIEGPYCRKGCLARESRPVSEHLSQNASGNCSNMQEEP